MKPEFDEHGFAATAGDIRVYYYDSETREYCGWSDEYINVGVSLPGSCTEIDPGEEVTGQISVFDGTGWISRADHRGEVVYSTTDGNVSIVDYIGDVRPGFTQRVPATSFDKWDGQNWVTDTAAESAAALLEVNSKKAALIAEASAMIAPLLDAREGGYIDDADLPVLASLQKYRYALTKVDPAKPVWPDKPAV
ncbi:tail fiber assembly protein [Citrobacter portucalensis]|uniref:tail fiber assembly protein n=1 Tax=Citrobacter portucalensis TaxID=1639133 RepID=UPI003896DDC9